MVRFVQYFLIPLGRFPTFLCLGPTPNAPIHFPKRFVAFLRHPSLLVPLFCRFHLRPPTIPLFPNPLACSTPRFANTLLPPPRPLTKRVTVPPYLCLPPPPKKAVLPKFFFVWFVFFFVLAFFLKAALGSPLRNFRTHFRFPFL